jgi:glycosyltransferase involved in cell wall biosynthesis
VFHEAKHERGALVLERIAKRVELAAYRDCDAIVAVSRPLRDILVEFGVRSSKIIVLPNGVDTQLFDPAAHDAAPRQFPGFTVGFVGAVIAWQGLEVLLRAVANIDAPVHVAIAGDGKDREQLEALARSLGLGPRVKFLGRLRGSDVPGFLSGIDVGFSGQQAMQIGSMYHSPLKLYEYLAMGKPAIASAFDDARGVIIDGRTGFLFEPGSQPALEQALDRAYAARGSLGELGSTARRSILDHHSWDARIRAMMDALGSI